MPGASPGGYGRRPDDWRFLAPQLTDLHLTLNEGRARHAFAIDPRQCMAPLPRDGQRADGLAYLAHVERRIARGAEMPESFWADPAMDQGRSDDLFGAGDDMACASEAFGDQAGAADAGIDLTFDFPQPIALLAKMRNKRAGGSIFGAITPARRGAGASARLIRPVRY